MEYVYYIKRTTEKNPYPMILIVCMINARYFEMKLKVMTQERQRT